MKITLQKWVASWFFLLASVSIALAMGWYEIRFGLEKGGLHSVIGRPIVYLGRCPGTLVTAHTVAPTRDRRALVSASLARLAIRTNGFQVEQQRLRLVGDLQARSLACGTRRYLPEPVLATDLVTRVHEVLEGGAGRILIVEDNPDFVRLHADLLSEDGLDVRAAANGLEALDRPAEGLPSVIVLDLTMPIMDGFAFLEYLRRDPVWSLIPVIILTAMIPSPEEVARLESSSVSILIKGRGATERVVDRILKTARTHSIVRDRVTT